MRISDWSSDVCSSDLVLHRSAGIGIFALAPDFAAGGFARSFQQHQGRIADEVEAVCSNSHAHDLGRRPQPRKTASLAPPMIGLVDQRAPRSDERQARRASGVATVTVYHY